MSIPPLEPAFPTPAIIAIVVTVAGLTVARAILGKPLRPTWLHAPVLTLRFAAIGLVAFFLLNPSEPILVKAPDSRSVLLLDESASMSLGEPSRWNEAKQWIAQFRGAMEDA